MAQPWLEDLSEEWIPQQTTPLRVADEGQESPVQPTLTATVPATQTSQSVPPKPRSRLPRLRQSSASFSEINMRHGAKSAQPSRRKSALVERSLSDNNISSADASQIVRSRRASQSFSAASPDAATYDGTVAQKISPKKDKSAHDTPEWRRRLLQGEIGYGVQKDLFGPSGLENMFHKPMGAPPEEKQSNRKLGLLKSLGAMPSSPPPWPHTDVKEGETISETQETPLDDSVSSRDLHGTFDGTVHIQHMPIQAHPSPNSTSISTVSDKLRLPSRAVSGQTEYENENFSPVYLSTNLKVGSAPGPIPNFRGSQLANRLRQLGTPPQAPKSHSPLEESSGSYDRGDSSFARFQEDSLPEGLPAGTPDIVDIGRFVEIRRGGYSRDGSFLKRPLSPSPQRPQTLSPPQIETTPPSESNENAQTTIDNQDSNSETPPRTPHRPTHTRSESIEKNKNSGSPLKLFDAHDTFTSNRLRRRLSQIELQTEKSSSSTSQTTKIETTKVIQKLSELTSVEEVSIQQGITVKARDGVQSKQNRLGTFGEGELNRYQFSGDFSALSSNDQVSNILSAPDESPSINAAPPGSRQPLRFHYDASPISRGASISRRQGLTRITNPFRTASQPKPHTTQDDSTIQHDLTESQAYAEGKRGPTSPFKNPTPKRRRTIQSLGEEEDGTTEGTESETSSTRDSNFDMQSLIGRKRKDARHEPSNNVADPEILARRHILRPRNPTPSQRRLNKLHDEIMEATEAFIQSSPKMEKIREHLAPEKDDVSSEEARAAVVANEVAAFSVRRQQTTRDDTRKKSVTTQDFLDEAVKIMNFIRAKGRPTSGLASLEESESESPAAQDHDGVPSISLTFDRPPSREGRLSAWKAPNTYELDSTLMNHLRKYQEQDSDDMLGSSFHSLRFSRMRGTTATEGESIVVEQNDIRITDDPNRRMSYNPQGSNQVNSQPIINDTHPSTNSSMGHTIATNASRRSDHVATLAPEAVAHLIPKEIAGMSFDSKNNCWVRRKSISKEQRHVEGYSTTNESEDDPFGNIPDLSVDETAERLQDKGSPTRPHATAETFLEDTEDANVAKQEEPARPVTREGKETAVTETSSVPSKASNFAWSFPKTETRATSYSDQATRFGGTQKANQQLPTTYAIPESEENDVEHEIQFFEGRGATTTGPRNTVRDITVSIAQRDNTSRQGQVPHVGSILKRPQQWSASNLHQQRSPKATAWNYECAQSLPSKRNAKRPIFNEDGDTSVLDDLPQRNYRMQLSMSVTTPALAHQDALMHAPSSPAKADVTFMLSDLPEFTMNQVDECELPNRVVVKHDGHRFSKALEDRYALGTAELVKALQDVEPDEPYWEDLREVDLHGRSLSNLHRLDEFCHRLEELNISDNGVDQVKGVPSTTRRLHAQNNCLTTLTTWSTLTNLQFLDISGNDVDSLDGLSELIHLRALKANDNKIESLEGIFHLDGLMELALARNAVNTVDFAAANLKSLVDLDLRGNCLYEVRNIDRLKQLQHLNLDDNRINEFPLFEGSGVRCRALRSLRLSGNGMNVLDIDDHFPKLESLYVDRNCLTNICGLEHLRYLRTFSAREQMLETDSDGETCINNLVRNLEVRSLHLSLNPTRSLEIPQHLLNLQRLELSSMGLTDLPSDFGQLTPNIRSINLNFNALQDLRPLLNIKRLTELLIAGNKLERLRANAMVLGKLGTLTKLDWRDNPLTLRFYPSASENRLMSLRQKPSDEQANDRFVLPDGDEDADEQYLLRLDGETRIRRRVTEMMLANLCVNLRELDGLTFDKSRILVKDDVWKRLLELGVIQRKQPDNTNENTES
ncbi:hypothetical protein DM02DRAFT_581024 [Periconia macrospinosa]|uniref:L domain-like protein n=1 Tax=Periconia macrospinosa TaxID=97972 RepID=A0A2V1EAP9_9PLEO|nr:hypothetical protein DM02DRAFT_581024 [Periconia macrospinosa]